MIQVESVWVCGLLLQSTVDDGHSWVEGGLREEEGVARIPWFRERGHTLEEMREGIERGGVIVM